jgi:GTP-binding protein
MRITTGKLNSMLADAMLRVQPPSEKGRRLKIYYITQPGIRPPSFICYCNNSELFHFSYLRYIENRIREVYGLQGTPVRMFVKEREQDLV